MPVPFRYHAPSLCPKRTPSRPGRGVTPFPLTLFATPTRWWDQPCGRTRSFQSASGVWTHAQSLSLALFSLFPASACTPPPWLYNLNLNGAPFRSKVRMVPTRHPLSCAMHLPFLTKSGQIFMTYFPCHFLC